MAHRLKGMTTRPPLVRTTQPICPWNERPLRIIAMNIRAWAGREKIRQSDLCEMLAVGAYRVRKVWRGHPSMSMTLALTIAQAMGMKYADVFDGVAE